MKPLSLHSMRYEDTRGPGVSTLESRSDLFFLYHEDGERLRTSKYLVREESTVINYKGFLSYLLKTTIV